MLVHGGCSSNAKVADCDKDWLNLVLSPASILNLALSIESNRAWLARLWRSPIPMYHWWPWIKFTNWLNETVWSWFSELFPMNLLIPFIHFDQSSQRPLDACDCYVRVSVLPSRSQIHDRYHLLQPVDERAQLAQDLLLCLVNQEALNTY